MNSIKNTYETYVTPENQEFVVEITAKGCAPAAVLTLLKASQSEKIDSSLISFFLVIASVCTFINIISHLGRKTLLKQGNH